MIPGLDSYFDGSEWIEHDHYKREKARRAEIQKSKSTRSKKLFTKSSSLKKKKKVLKTLFLDYEDGLLFEELMALIMGENPNEVGQSDLEWGAVMVNEMVKKGILSTRNNLLIWRVQELELFSSEAA
ncbi:MAG: hypothetical protein AAGA75_00020 [Cyanobacteria bacterium P01_E01_bin.6]